jgi:PDZ domain-containing secreted protein
VDHRITRGITIDGDVDIGGAIITGVEPDTPAASAGLQAGEMIFSVDGEPLSRENPLPEALSKYAPGDEATLEVGLPAGEKRQVTITLGEHPEKDGSAYLGIRYFNLPGLGGIIGLEALPFDLPPLEGESQGIPRIPFEREFRFFHGPPFEGERPFRGDIPIPEGDFEQGILIEDVMEGSAAEDAGLKAGDWILEVDGETFDSTDSFINLIQDHQPGDSIILLLFHPKTGETLEVEVILGEHPDKGNSGFLGINIGGMFIRRSGDPGGELDREFFFHHDFDFHHPFDFHFPPEGFHKAPETPMQEG